jgi:hypothetical protein
VDYGEIGPDKVDIDPDKDVRLQAKEWGKDTLIYTASE